MWTNIEPHTNLDEMFVRGDELLFKPLFLKDSTTFSHTVTLFLPFPTIFFRPLSYGGFFTLYSFLSNHLNRTLVTHLNLHSSACPIRHFLWLSVHGRSLSFRYFYILIFFVRAWGSSLSLDISKRSPKSPTYLLDWY